MTPHLAGLALSDLRNLLTGWDEPAYRADQIFRSLHGKGTLAAKDMTTLPQALRERLDRETVVQCAREIEVETAADGTEKALLELGDRRRVESVLIPDGNRRTVCVSTQVGCAVGCVFCASGVGGLVRNLSTGEIVEQVLHTRNRLGDRPSHIVIMGMGEPLQNLAAVSAAVRIWTDPNGAGFSPRRITVSTAASSAQVDRLLEEDLGINLAVSLHAPDDETRRILVPNTPPGRTADLLDAAARYAQRTGRDATAEYVLVRGVNDRPEQAQALGALLAGRHTHVNLIPLNPVPHRPDLETPTLGEARIFLSRVRDAGASATLRSRRGEEIRAACGQLALERSLPPGDPGPDRPA